MSSYKICFSLFGILAIVPSTNAQEPTHFETSDDLSTVVACQAIDIRQDTDGVVRSALIDSFFLPRQSYIWNQGAWTADDASGGRALRLIQQHHDRSVFVSQVRTTTWTTQTSTTDMVSPALSRDIPLEMAPTSLLVGPTGLAVLTPIKVHWVRDWLGSKHKGGWHSRRVSRGPIFRWQWLDSGLAIGQTFGRSKAERIARIVDVRYSERPQVSEQPSELVFQVLPNDRSAHYGVCKTTVDNETVLGICPGGRTWEDVPTIADRILDMIKIGNETWLLLGTDALHAYDIEHEELRRVHEFEFNYTGCEAVGPRGETLRRMVVLRDQVVISFSLDATVVVPLENADR